MTFVWPALSTALWWALLIALPLAGCAGLPTSPGRPAATEVAAGVYMLRGADGEAGPDNLGRIGNAGFIVGPAGVLAIDSGTSYRHGLALLDAIAEVTDRPVRLLLLTHTRQEFLFGAAAFQQRGVPVAMHGRAAGLMAARCEGCLKTLRRTLGEDEMRGTIVVKPDRLFDATHLLALIGRPVRVLYFGHSSGPGDIAVFDEDTGTLFAGGLLDQGRISDVQDSDLAGWTLALTAMRALPVRRIVPGHGPAAGAELMRTAGSYLTQLQAGAQKLLEAGAALSEVPDGLQLDEFKDWDQYDTIHRRNAALVFLRLEQQRLTR